MKNQRFRLRQLLLTFPLIARHSVSAVRADESSMYRAFAFNGDGATAARACFYWLSRDFHQTVDDGFMSHERDCVHDLILSEEPKRLKAKF